MIWMNPSANRPPATAFPRRQGGRPGWLAKGRWAAVFLALGLAALIAGAFLSDARGPQAATEIFQGVVYGREQLAPTDEGSGFLHWLRVDLTAPGIELYVTQLDPGAVARGWQYRLRWIREVVDRERLAVAINGMMFTSASIWKLRLPGDLARGVETAVANHVVSHVWEHAYVLWFEDDLTPHLEPVRPQKAADLLRAKWGMGGLALWLQGGKVWPGSDRSRDSRTAVAIDAERKILFLGVGESISPRLILQKLADLGAKQGMLLDGGGSSSLAIGEGARQIASGVLYGGLRAVATHVGVRARTLPPR
jgi:hypothetical protein